MLTKSKSFLYIALALAAGIALLLLPGTGGTESTTVSAPSSAEYTAALEKKVASLISERMPTVEGVAVVCKGASAATEQKIISLLSALFNIKSNKISVITQ